MNAMILRQIAKHRWFGPPVTFSNTMERGILSSLSLNGNAHTLGILNVTSAQTDKDSVFSNFKVIEYETNKENRWWTFEQPPYWQVGANDLLFQLTHYTVRNAAITSCSLYNWTFAGSMDGEAWEVLDTRTKDTTIHKSKMASYDFPITMRAPMHYFRIAHYGLNQCGNLGLAIGSFDLYGVLFTLHPMTQRHRRFSDLQTIISLFLIQ